MWELFSFTSFVLLLLSLLISYLFIYSYLLTYVLTDFTYLITYLVLSLVCCISSNDIARVTQIYYLTIISLNPQSSTNYIIVVTPDVFFPPLIGCPNILLHIRPVCSETDAGRVFYKYINTNTVRQLSPHLSQALFEHTCLCQMVECPRLWRFIQLNSVIMSWKGLNILYQYKQVLF